MPSSPQPQVGEAFGIDGSPSGEGDVGGAGGAGGAVGAGGVAVEEEVEMEQEENLFEDDDDDGLHIRIRTDENTYSLRAHINLQTHT
jgi:hypothetical protein